MHLLLKSDACNASAIGHAAGFHARIMEFVLKFLFYSLPNAVARCIRSPKRRAARFYVGSLAVEEFRPATRNYHVSAHISSFDETYQHLKPFRIEHKRHSSYQPIARFLHVFPAAIVDTRSG